MSRLTVRLSIFRRLSCAPVLFLLACSAMAQSVADTDPLFASHDILNVKIFGPLTSIMRERDDENDVPGMFQYLDAAGQPVELDIGLRARGNFRRDREICDFVPLRLNFKTSKVDQTLFEHQDKLKLVTHCQDGSNYQNSLLREYLAYRVFNIVTSLSFRVRLLHITYVDTDHKNHETVRYGFLIEHKDRFAQRNSGHTVEVQTMTVKQLQPAYTNLTSLFHYFLGNVDFSHVSPEIDDGCCHNQEVFLDNDGLYVSIPYDFDMSRFVDAEYLEKSTVFDVLKRRQRSYRGWCVNNAQLPTSVNIFNDKRVEISELVNDFEPLSKFRRNSLMRFVNKSFADVSTTAKTEKYLVKQCMELGERRS